MSSEPDIVVSQPQKLDIRMISDPNCPNCYLGYKKLRVALEQAEREGLLTEFTLKLEPFLLDHELPVDTSVDKREYMLQHDGPEEAWVDRAKPWFKLSYGGRLRSTIKAHRLVHKAGERGVQVIFHELLWKSQFEEEGDIGDEDTLSSLALAAGLFETKTEVKAFLASSEGVDEYWAGVMTAMRMGVRGVPYFILNGWYSVQGAVEPSDFGEAFRSVLSMSED